MSDWSSDAAQKLRRKQEFEKLKAELELQHGKLLENGAPVLWDALRKQLEIRCADFNSEDGMRDTLTFANVNQHKVRIEANRRNNIEVECSPTQYSVFVSGRFASSYKMELVDGTSEVRFSSGHQTFLAHEIAQKILAELLGI